MSIKILNMGLHPAAVQILTEDQKVDYVHLAPKAKVDLPEGAVPSDNWLALNPKVKVMGPKPSASKVAYNINAQKADQTPTQVEEKA